MSNVVVQKNQDYIRQFPRSIPCLFLYLQNFIYFFFFIAEGLETQVTESEHGKRFTVTSRLRLKPTSADDYMEYSCQARHKALTPDMPMRSTVQLSVLCKSINFFFCNLYLFLISI